MPQLDKFAFAPQVFWLVLVFFTLYLLLLKDGLSTLYKILVFRRRLIINLNTTSMGLAQEGVVLRFFSFKLLSSFVQTKAVSDFFLKLLDNALLSTFQKNYLLIDNRGNLVSSNLALMYTAKRQFVTPALSVYLTVKF